jgi:hypothetical protein
MSPDEKSEFNGDSTLLFLHNAIHGPIVNSPEMACDIGRLVFARLYGETKMKREEPFRYRDDGDTWTVAGSYQPPDLPDGTGVWFIKIKKSNAEVLKVARSITFETIDSLSSRSKIGYAGEEPAGS